MARKKDTEDSVAVTAAKAVGTAAGRIAALAASAGPLLKAAVVKRGKPAPKNKSRLPRKEKKARQKAGKRAAN